jgi:SAM-dependent methyltransferase
MNKDKVNPWLSIPAEDYEGHMQSPAVNQSVLLSNAFHSVLIQCKPRRIAVLGAGTGNGFEHIIWNGIDLIDVYDINPEFLAICRRRFSDEKMNIVCADLEQFAFPAAKYDLIYAALFFEYVDVSALLEKIYSALMTEGHLVILIQLPSDSQRAITETPCESLKALYGRMRLYAKDEIIKYTMQMKFRCIQETELQSTRGKKFFLGIFIKEI